ncbi:MAG TPA: molybdopterin-binding protein [Candidatus Anoxymicrobiaceae bacterium]
MLRQSEREAMEMKISARNMLKGKVTSVNHGAVNSEVVIELPCGQKIVSVITKASAEGLGLAPGMDAYAVVKATSVMIGVD